MRNLTPLYILNGFNSYAKVTYLKKDIDQVYLEM